MNYTSYSSQHNLLVFNIFVRLLFGVDYSLNRVFYLCSVSKWISICIYLFTYFRLRLFESPIDDVTAQYHDEMEAVLTPFRKGDTHDPAFGSGATYSVRSTN